MIQLQYGICYYKHLIILTMTFNLKQFYPIIFLQIAHFCLISHSQLQLDNDYYSDKAYDDYVEEYERNLKVSGMDDDYEYHEENGDNIKYELKQKKCVRTNYYVGGTILLRI